MNRKESKPFGESGIWKWLVLAVFLLTAGCLFSCGASEVSMEVELSGTEVSDRSGSEDNEDSENDGNSGENSDRSRDKTTGKHNGENTESADVKPEKDRADDAESVEKRMADDETGAKEDATAGIIDEPGDCFVYVCGEVRSPGVYCMKEGQRIFEAVEQAGGFTEQAVREYLNLADQISDGMKVFVPNVEQVQSGQVMQENVSSGTPGEKDLPESGKTGTVSAKVNLNTASKEELMTLRGIGSARAEDIIRYRETNGRFQKIEEIKKVSGIKDAAFEKIKDQITV